MEVLVNPLARSALARPPTEDGIELITTVGVPQVRT